LNQKERGFLQRIHAVLSVVPQPNCFGKASATVRGFATYSIDMMRIQESVSDLLYMVGNPTPGYTAPEWANEIEEKLKALEAHIQTRKNKDWQ
jgi:hypothetical protein